MKVVPQCHSGLHDAMVKEREEQKLRSGLTRMIHVKWLTRDGRYWTGYVVQKKGGWEGVYVPGSVFVVTSVSTVLLRSTTPLRLGGSFAPSTIIGCLVCTLLEGWDRAKSLVSV